MLSPLYSARPYEWIFKLILTWSDSEGPVQQVQPMRSSKGGETFFVFSIRWILKQIFDRSHQKCFQTQLTPPHIRVLWDLSLPRCQREMGVRREPADYYPLDDKKICRALLSETGSFMLLWIRAAFPCTRSTILYQRSLKISQIIHLSPGKVKNVPEHNLPSLDRHSASILEESNLPTYL